MCSVIHIPIDSRYFLPGQNGERIQLYLRPYWSTSFPKLVDRDGKLRICFISELTVFLLQFPCYTRMTTIKQILIKMHFEYCIQGMPLYWTEVLLSSAK